MSKRWLPLLLPTLIAGTALTGCGAASAATNSNEMGNQTSTMGSSNMTSNSAMTSNSTMSTSPMVHSTTQTKVGTPLMTGDVLLGAAASSPMGSGNGVFYMDHLRKGVLTTIPLAQMANAFRVAVVGNVAYVPTLQGQTYIVNLQSNKVTGHFSSPKGARIANTAQYGHLLVITGGTSVSAYSLPDHKMKWQLPIGGNTLAIANNTAYLSSNSAAKTTLINLTSGKQMGTIPVGHIEDSVYDKQTQTLWMADWMNGDMTVVNTRNNHTIKTIHKAEGGGFSMSNMMNSTGGFMQLAAGPKGKFVYAASFSGNIMVYNATANTFAKDIPIGKQAKLSGIAVDPSGRYIYTTVENAKNTVGVSLKTGKIVTTMQGMIANRWTVIH